MNFIHISDLHFKDTGNDCAEKLLSFINEHYPAHNLIVTGDITDDGSQVEYERAFAALAPFMGRIFICPGNHDFGKNGMKFSRERAERFDEMLCDRLDQKGTFYSDNLPVVNKCEDNDDKVALIALDTNLETRTVADLACGFVGATQLSWLHDNLMAQEYDHYTKILFFHHHLFDHGDPLLTLKNADDLIYAIQGNVDIVCFGHKHFKGRWQGLYDIKYILAADKSPGSGVFTEINIKRNIINITERTRW
jgi:3',5'-cyclic AMP phosphodiesterase CpdA